MNELALFAGCGGGILGGKLLGWRTICAVEINAFCARRLMQRQNEGHIPPFPIWDDVCSFDGRPWRGRVEVVSGGFPCQDISSAGKGEGIGGARSGLWKEMSRIIGEVRPRYAFVENSPVLTSRGLGVVLGDLAEMGYDTARGVFRACDVGAPHLRERIWIVAYDAELFSDSVKNDASTCGTYERELGGKVVCRASANSDGARGERLEQAEDIGIAGQWNWRGKEDLQSLLAAPTRSAVWPQPLVCRVDDGLADRLVRLKAIGNGQVPDVARLAWKTLNA